MERTERIIDKKGTVVFLATLPFCFPYYALLTAGDLAQDLFSRRVNSEEELKTLVNQEAEKLGLSKRGLIATLTPYSEARASVWGLDIRDRENPKIVPLEQVNGKEVLMVHEVELGGSHATRARARHEVFHLARGHCESSDGTYTDKFRYIFIREP